MKEYEKILMEDRKEQKKQLRKKIKEKIKSLPLEYCRLADETIARKTMELEEYQKAQVIFCYVGTDREINTFPILEDILKSGKRLGVPRCISYGEMEVYEIESLRDLETGAYGIMEPKEHCRRIAPEEIDFAILPCLTCTMDGRRLGYGGGFYDRYLPKMSCQKAVLCRSALMEEEIPMDEYDVKIDVVITEGNRK